MCAGSSEARRRVVLCDASPLIFLAKERFAQSYGIEVIGFCGLLVQAAKQGHLSARQARDCVDRAIRDHSCRLSVDVYRRILTELEGLSDGDAE